MTGCTHILSDGFQRYPASFILSRTAWPALEEADAGEIVARDAEGVGCRHPLFFLADPFSKALLLLRDFGYWRLYGGGGCC